MIPLVLLPGMMCDARLFAPQIADLSRDTSLICVPVTGHSDLTALAQQVLATAPERFALAGLSMGGIVAMEVARLAPRRIAGLALLDTNQRAEKPEIKARRLPQIDAVQRGELHRVMRDEMKPNYLSDGPEREAILGLCMDMAMGLGPEVFITQSRALMDRHDQSDTLRGFTPPSLVLCGRDDALCPVFRHQEMHDLLPNSTLTVLDGAGHLPTLEQPEQTTNALRGWLEAL